MSRQRRLMVLLAASAVLACTDALADRQYTVTPLPSSVNAINNLGDAAGTAANTPPYLRAFRWSQGSSVDLGSLGDAGSRGYGINDRGQVVGDSDTAPIGGGGSVHAFLYSDGKMSDLGTLGGSNSTAIAINQRGDIAGTSDTAPGQQHAFLYRAGAMTDLGTLDGKASTAMDLNLSGQVVGESGGRAFLYDGTMHALGSSSGYSIARAINDGGQVVGLEGSSGFDGHAFLYSKGQVQDLGTLGERFSSAFDINNKGEIVGWTDVTGHDGRLAFLYADGQMRTLDSMILGPSPASFNMAFAINDAGQILADGCDALACGSYLLTPVPEPGAWLMAGSGALLLMFAGRLHRRGRSRGRARS